MKIKKPCNIYTFICIACSKLLKLVHVTKLYIIQLINMVSETYKKTVLIKIIVHNFFAKIDMNFII